MSIKSDKSTEDAITKYLDAIKKEVGAKKISIGTLKGSFAGKLTFEEKLIEIAFDRA